MTTASNFDHLIGSFSDKENIISELDVLGSIYGDQAISPWYPSSSTESISTSPNTVRYQVSLSLPPPHDAIHLLVLVSLSPSYPATSPPQLQLLSRYVGAFGVDTDLFGSIIKTFMSVNGVEWTPGMVCVFDGLENVTGRVVQWYEQRLESMKAGEELREQNHPHLAERPHLDGSFTTSLPLSLNPQSVELPGGIELVEAEPIVDRKSVFVGRACRISDPSQVIAFARVSHLITEQIARQVPLILAFLMADRRVTKAAHPIINAWRCQVGNVLYQDNGDDGESAAGGRLAHLLQILDVKDVLVVVTRYFGGTLLGADRFKHINQAARDALELGAFIEVKGVAAESRSRGFKR